MVAGEASGDRHGAHLIEELLKRDSSLEIRGLGGVEMRAAGMQLLQDLTQIAVLGLCDVLKKYFVFRRIFHKTLREIKRFRPDLVILIDYPGFNLRLAKKIKKKFSLPIIYYISPQVWAWGARRIKTIRRVVDKMLVLFHFEEKIYNKMKIPVEWVGHPLVDDFKPSASRSKLHEEFGGDKQHPIVALLPGSRLKEVERILPTMLETASKIRTFFPEARFVLTRSPNIEEKAYEKAKETDLDIQLILNRTHDILTASDFALITSGTTTLEAAMALIPFVILYKAGRLTYWVGKRLVRLPYIGMVNVIAHRKIVPEFLQREANPVTIAHETAFILKNDDAREKMQEYLKAVKETLGPAGASERAAIAVLDFLKSRS